LKNRPTNICSRLARVASCFQPSAGSFALSQSRNPEHSHYVGPSLSLLVHDGALPTLVLFRLLRKRNSLSLPKLPPTRGFELWSKWTAESGCPHMSVRGDLREIPRSVRRTAALGMTPVGGRSRGQQQVPFDFAQGRFLTGPLVLFGMTRVVGGEWVFS
jgi:hypothetical protein